MTLMIPCSKTLIVADLTALPNTDTFIGELSVIEEINFLSLGWHKEFPTNILCYALFSVQGLFLTQNLVNDIVSL